MALEIKCKNIGNEGCNWKAVANTEDRLIDYMAVHSRDQHGINNFTQEMIAQAKSVIKEAASEKEGDPAMMEYHCPDCNWKYFAQTTDLIVDAAALHARDDHNVTEFGEEMKAKVKNSLKPWSG